MYLERWYCEVALVGVMKKLVPQHLLVRLKVPLVQVVWYHVVVLVVLWKLA